MTKIDVGTVYFAAVLLFYASGLQQGFGRKFPEPTESVECVGLSIKQESQRAFGQQELLLEVVSTGALEDPVYPHPVYRFRLVTRAFNS